MLLPLNQSKIPKVFTIHLEQIKSVAIGLAPPRQSLIEETVSLAVETNDFSVENCVFHGKSNAVTGRVLLGTRLLIRIRGDFRLGSLKPVLTHAAWLAYYGRIKKRRYRRSNSRPFVDRGCGRTSHLFPFVHPGCTNGTTLCLRLDRGHKWFLP
jgi:hypothetical protein